jgi:hypothetical protein
VGCCSVVEPATAGDVVLVSTHFYGKPLEAVDRRTFAYNPPEVIRTDARGEVLKPEPFIPQVERDGDLLRMPITFPDGTEATVVFPIPLDLATRGLFPSVSYEWRADQPPKFPIIFLHDPNASIAEYVEGGEPLGVVDSYRSVEIWRFSDFWLRHRAVLPGHWLRYRLPDWTVLVAIGPREDADRVAANLSLEQTTAGYPLATPSGPLALASLGREGEGPQLSIGPGSDDPEARDGLIDLNPGGCSGSAAGELAPSEQHYSRCFDGQISMNVTGDPPFVRAVRDGATVDYSEPIDPTPCVPTAVVADGMARVPLTFPDGTAVTLTYPSIFGLVNHGVQPDTAYDSKRTGLVPIMFVHGPAGAEERYLRGVSPVANAAGPDGTLIPLWEAVPLHESSIDPTHWLVRRAGSWSVLVGVRDLGLADEVATSIAVHLAKTGMPWIQPIGEFSLSPFAGEGGGTVLTIGDHEPSPRSLRLDRDFANFATIELTPRACDERIEERSLDVNGKNLFGTLCRADGRVIVSIHAERTFANGLLEDLRMEDFRQA